MTIDEAIKVMEDNRYFFESDGFVECAEACQLGIEALKREVRNRRMRGGVMVGRLPGETEE